MKTGLCQKLGIAFGLAALGACATQKSTESPSGTLAVCQGVRVSNAPATDRDGAVLGFAPFARFKGNRLSLIPVSGCLSSGYGKRRGGAGSVHEGIDLFTGRPVPVRVAGKGRISFVGRQRGYGRLVEITHRNGVRTRYAHLSDITDTLVAGRRVQAGQIIGRTGATGNATAVHLHFEILSGNRPVNPLGLPD